MLYRCIWPGCTKVWGEPVPKANRYSHGLCPRHARVSYATVFRRQQRQEGNPDCYLRHHGYCHQSWCTYYPICINESPRPKHIRELERRLEVRRRERREY